VRAATCSKTANPIRMRDFARLTFCYDEILARHGSPGDIGRASASAAIDAMTIDQSKRPTLQHVSCPAANASTCELHRIRLAHFNHELTRINTNRCSPPEAGRRPRPYSASWGAVAATSFSSSARNVFLAIPNFTGSRRSMSLKEVRRLD
jgi:hypothetical protein